MELVEIPPGATVFQSGGKTYFLYLGAIEMVALQREWGLTHGPTDSGTAWEKKQVEFQERLDGGAMEDKLAVIRHGLMRWSRAAGNGSGPVQITDDLLESILAGIEQPEGKKRKSSFVIATELHRRFFFDCFGLPSDSDKQESGGPKGQGGEDSTPSSS